MGDNKFLVGEIIHHKRYGYRGVIVEFDRHCTADQGWYQKNQTQPDREQPWYHVLVDGATQTAYVAQENLEPDKIKTRVQHPLVSRYFTSFYLGRYHKESLN